MVKLDMKEIVKNTPISKWYEGLSEIYKTPNNISNMFRASLLYKYGGIYSDLDIIIFR